MEIIGFRRVSGKLDVINRLGRVGADRFFYVVGGIDCLSLGFGWV